MDHSSPLRVLLVAPSPPPYGGMALQARQLERLLRGEGHEVTFLASNFALPRILNRLPGVRTLARAVLIWWKLARAVRKAEMVHVLAASWVYFFFVVYPAVTVGYVSRRRVIVNYRGGEAKAFFRRYGWLAWPVFQMATVVTAPSEFLAEIIRERFGVSVSIVPNLLDSSMFQYRQRAAIQPRMLVTRHLEKIYDIESVLRAFGWIQQRYPEASLWIAGTGAEETRLRTLAADWGLRNVSFLGPVAHRDLPAIYDQCDIYLNASRADNFPGALVEASAAGLVVVTTAAGGIPFLYRNGETAILVEPGDWKALAAAVQNVLEEPAKALAVARAATAVARACSWSEVRKRLYAAYGRGEGSARTIATKEGTGCVVG